MDRPRIVACAVATVIALLAWLWTARRDSATMDTSPIDLRFSYVPGIFEHDLQPTGPADGFRAKTLPRFGIIDRVYDQATDQGKGQWERLSDHLKRRNAANPTSERFKVLFIARHGEGECCRPSELLSAI